MVKTYINYGGGVNSTAILSLMCKKKLIYENPIITLADTGAERPETYEYLPYIQEKLKKYGFKIRIVKSKEGTLTDYCKNKFILPMRRLRGCTDRWKRKPLEQNVKEGDLTIIGIDYGERKRTWKWDGRPDVIFPLIDLKMDRKMCIDEIKSIGWKVPIKSGCWFCPFAKMAEFKELKLSNPDLFNELCEMEKVTLQKFSKTIKGWYDQKRPLNKAVEHKYPETHKDQSGLCIYCEI